MTYRYMNVLCICCCTITAAPLKFELLVRETFSFQQNLAAFWCINVSFIAKGLGGESCMCGSLLL
jgi:hypothetical protein